MFTNQIKTVLIVLLSWLPASMVQAQSPWASEGWGYYGQVMTDWFALQSYSVGDGADSISDDTANAADLQGLGLRLGVRGRSIGDQGGVQLIGAGLSGLQVSPSEDSKVGPDIMSFGGYVEGGLGRVWPVGFEIMGLASLGLDQINAEWEGHDIDASGYTTRFGLELGWNFERALLSLGAHMFQTESLSSDEDVSYSGHTFTGSFVWWW